MKLLSLINLNFNYWYASTGMPYVYIGIQYCYRRNATLVIFIFLINKFITSPFCNLLLPLRVFIKSCARISIAHFHISTARRLGHYVSRNFYAKHFRCPACTAGVLWARISSAQHTATPFRSRTRWRHVCVRRTYRP